MQNLGQLDLDDGIRTITVNDKGDYIAFSINDKSIAEKFSKLIQWYEQKRVETEEYEKNFKKKYEYIIRTDEQGELDINTEAIVESTEYTTDMCRQACEKIDGIFGEGSCKKVFGDIVPDISVIGIFLMKLVPFMEKAGQERQKYYEKFYNTDRKGFRSKIIKRW